MHPWAPVRPIDPTLTPPDERRRPRGGSLEPHDQSEAVDEASDESFPASDPPAWTPVTHVETPRVPDEALLPPT
jgi:hypothetical protein